MKPLSRYRGCIKLSAIGDAMGWITEFEKDSDSIRSKYGSSSIERFYDWNKYVGGRFNGFKDQIKAGSYSDDTQLLLAVARSINSDGFVDQKYFSKIELSNWLLYARGGGRTVKNAADKISRKSAKWNTNFFSFKVGNGIIDYTSCGANGAAMRVLPITLANVGDLQKIKEQIFENSIITHGHPRAILGAMIYGFAINHILLYRVENFKWQNFITQIGSNFATNFNISFIYQNIELSEWLKQWNMKNSISFEQIFAETMLEAQNLLRLIYHSIKQNLPVADTLKKIGCFEPNIKGSGIITVIAGIYLATKFAFTPKEGIITAVNALNSDTDSIAAFTGALLGALHGDTIIPSHWKQVQDAEYLDQIAQRLLDISEDKFNYNVCNNIAKGKSLNTVKDDNYEINEQVTFIPLGEGTIFNIDRQNTLTKGKYNLILDVQIFNGQSIRIHKLLENHGSNLHTEFSESLNGKILEIGKQRLSPSTFYKLSTYLAANPALSIPELEILDTIIRNDD
jgi:ADP-ribosylglycohydrolase